MPHEARSSIQWLLLVVNCCCMLSVAELSGLSALPFLEAMQHPPMPVSEPASDQPIDPAQLANSTETLVILGAGPAGLSAAIYASRANLRPLVISHDGGQLSSTGLVENFPSCSWNASGSEIMQSFKTQAVQFGARFGSLTVESVNLRRKPYSLTSTGGVVLFFKALIIASGATSKWLNAPGEAEYFNKGVAACATCDGWFFKGQRVVVVGGGDTAMETALFLARICTSVKLIVRGGSVRASKIMADRARLNPKVEFVWNSTVSQFEGDGSKLTAVVVRDTAGLERRIPTEGAFVAIGHKPNTAMFTGEQDLGKKCSDDPPQIATDPEGYIRTMAGSHTATSVAGVFAAGDAADRVYRQAITSAGTGAMAAMDAERWLCAEGC